LSPGRSTTSRPLSALPLLVIDTAGLAPGPSKWKPWAFPPDASPPVPSAPTAQSPSPHCAIATLMLKTSIITTVVTTTMIRLNPGSLPQLCAAPQHRCRVSRDQLRREATPLKVHSGVGNPGFPKLPPGAGKPSVGKHPSNSGDPTDRAATRPHSSHREAALSPSSTVQLPAPVRRVRLPPGGVADTTNTHSSESFGARDPLRSRT
jgi:hypothetical protein